MALRRRNGPYIYGFFWESTSLKGRVMTRIHTGYRVGRLGIPRLAVAAAVFRGDKLLLIKRTDSLDWALPSGGVDAGESISEACLRELEEETSVTGRVAGLIGIYSSPNYLIEYRDGEKVQPFAIVLRVEAADFSHLRPCRSEAVEARWFSATEIEWQNINPLHVPRIRRCFLRVSEPEIA